MLSFIFGEVQTNIVNHISGTKASALELEKRELDGLSLIMMIFQI